MSSKVKKREKEEQNEPQDYSEYRPKKLRMIVKEKSALTVLEDSAKVGDAANSLRYLREFQRDFMLNIKIHDCRAIMSRLCTLVLQSPEDSLDVRLEAVHCIQYLVSNQSIESAFAFFIEDVIGLMRTLMERNGSNDAECYSQILYLCGPSIISANENSAAVSKIDKMCHEVVKHQNWMIRVASMKWLVHHVRYKSAKLFYQNDLPKLDRSMSQEDDSKMVVYSQSSVKTDQEYIEELLCSSMRDRDPRVRTTAVECLLRTTELMPEEGGCNLSSGNYEYFASLLHDSEENVRTNALRIIKHIADQNPEKKVEGANKGISLRLVDDSFSKMCNAVHDLSLRVRTEAALLLGEFQNVSTSFLEQTLDKKLMSRMKFLSTGHTSKVQEWATGRKFGEDAPVEKMEEETSSMIPSGACGAFVTGLEDEYMVVRQAAVRSLSELATGRPTFAAKAVDFLADMFNDEIEEVRLDAVNYLRPLVQHTMLQDEQMQPILNMLDDAMADSRLALRELLTDCRLANTSAVRMTVDALLNNLRRYPSDRESIWTCMRNVGRSHPAQIAPFVVDMLGVHPYLHGPEPTLDNHSYMARLVLVLNAAASCPTLQSLFPDFVWKQHRFLHESSPGLVPVLQPWKLMDSTKFDEEGKDDNVWRSALKKLAMVDQLQTNISGDLLQLVMRDLSKLGELGGMCQVGALYLLACCKLRASLNALVKSARQVVMDVGGLRRSFEQINAQCRLRCALAAALAHGFTPLRLSSIISAFELFKSRLQDHKSDACCQHENVAAAMELALQPVINGDTSQIDGLVRILNDQPLSLPTSIRYDQVVEKRCTITEPESDCDNVIRFVAGLVTCIPLSASIRGCSDGDIAMIRVKVEYPDGRVELQRPRPTDIRRLSPNLIRLSMQVLVKAALWSHKATAKLTIGLLNESSVFVGDETNLNSFVAVKSGSEFHADSCVCVSLFPKAKC